MNNLKKAFIIISGSVCTFLILDYTLGEKLRDKYSVIESMNSDEDTRGLARTFSHGQVNQKNLLAMNTQPVVDFNKNTYENRLDTNGKPQLKRGKRYYDAEAMDEISTSANIEAISREDE